MGRPVGGPMDGIQIRKLISNVMLVYRTDYQSIGVLTAVKDTISHSV